MIRRTPPLSPETRELLEVERDVPPLPASVRARALVRARAALAAGAGARPASAAPTPRFRWAAAAALALMASGAVAAAYEIRARFFPSTEGPVTSPVEVKPVAQPAPAAPSTELVSPEPAAPIAAADPDLARAATEPRLSRADAVRAELRLLRQARAAVAREDFAAALGPITEHARRFKDGRLVEEREALRVKALVGLGRTEEARRAAAHFEARFPHSVLLPAVSQMSASGR